MNNKPSEIISALAGLLFFFGVGIIGVAILIFSLLYSRTKSGIISCGFVAATFMALQCLLLGWMAGIGSATSGSQSGYNLLLAISCFFILCLIVYFAIGLGRIKK